MFDDNIIIKRKYLSPVLNSKQKKSDSIYNLKSNSPFPDLCSIIDQTNLPQHVQNYIFGNPLPDSYDTLGFLEKGKYINCSDDISSEINWALLTIRKFKKEILLFLQYKKTFEEAFLLGNYEICEEYLTKIETEICYSIWSLESRFLLCEFSQSPESHKSFLSKFNAQNKGFFTLSLAHNISNRSEKNFSVLKYNSDIFEGINNFV